MKLGAMSSWIVRAANDWAWVCVIHGDVLVSVFWRGSIIQSRTVLLMVTASMLLSISFNRSSCLCGGHSWMRFLYSIRCW